MAKASTQVNLAKSEGMAALNWGLFIIIVAILVFVISTLQKPNQKIASTHIYAAGSVEALSAIITMPAQGATITTQDVILHAEFDDQVGIQGVAFYLDNKIIEPATYTADCQHTATATTGACITNLNKDGKLAPGQHIVRAIAVSKSGLKQASNAVGFSFEPSK